ncbi:MAG: hypothetical protein RR619_10385, partial [Raoultibacter sp.]
ELFSFSAECAKGAFEAPFFWGSVALAGSAFNADFAVLQCFSARTVTGNMKDMHNWCATLVRVLLEA